MTDEQINNSAGDQTTTEKKERLLARPIFHIITNEDILIATAYLWNNGDVQFGIKNSQEQEG